MGITVVFDATHANIGSLPPNGACAGYVTGSPDIAWTSADWNNHPGAIRIDQSPSSGVWDATADVDDFETGAVLVSELAPRAKLRKQAFANGTRPGQREPLVYASAVNVTNVANALVNGGVSSGVGLFVADWNLTDPEAIAMVVAGAGPFPIRGVQFHNAGTYDMSVFDTGWLSNVSGAVVQPSARSGVQYGWRFCSKCSALVHSTGPGMCAGGGVHNIGESHDYAVSWNDTVG
jgi:hypothetical protein